MSERRSKRAKASTVSKANDSDVARMREMRISKLESDANDDAVVDDADDDDDFDVSHCRRCLQRRELHARPARQPNCVLIVLGFGSRRDLTTRRSAPIRRARRPKPRVSGGAPGRRGTRAQT